MVTLFAAGAAYAPVWFMTSMPGRSFRGAPAPLNDAQKETRARVEREVRALSVDIGERTTQTPSALDRARDQIEGELRAIGYEPERQTYDVGGVACSNIEARASAPSARSAEIVIVGAHYDSAIGAAAADDDASGVAAMLEIARALKGAACARELRFVAFVNEEMPHFKDGTMGSQRYAARCADRGERIAAMLSLESIGYYADAPGSQRLPFPMDLFFPDRGDFLGFVANTSSRSLVRALVGTFRASAELPSEGAAVLESTFGARFSDHAAFWDHGWPAVMVTDTAFMRNPNYHTRRDLPETLDFDRLTRATIGLTSAVRSIACPP